MATTSTFAEKIIAFQTKVSAVKKGKENPHFKSKYADINIYLAEIKPVLSECSLYLVQPIETVDGNMILRTIVTDGTDKIESIMPIPQTSKIQELGAAITYLRRYAIQSLLALGAEDDDGNSVNVQTPRFTEAHAKAISEINTVADLKTYYGAHKGLGAEFAKAVTARKMELQFTPKPVDEAERLAEAFGGEVIDPLEEVIAASDSNAAKLMKKGMKEANV